MNLGPFTGILTLVVFTPLAGAMLILLTARKDSLVRLIALSVTLFNFVLSGIIFVIFDESSSQRFQMIDRFDWFNSHAFDVTYQMGVDGISAPLVLLTGLLGFIAVLASWKIVLRVKEYFVWILVLQTAVMGVFTSLDFILFFVFWELELIPMYFLISIWGTGRKQYSAMKFLIFTFLGSAFMLVGIIALYLSPDVRHFDMIILAENGTMNIQSLVPLTVIFWFFLIGFLVKLPVIPVHTWLPDAHTDAPTAVSIMLAGVLLKMGGYGLLRITVGMFPDITIDHAVIFAILAVVSILYGAVLTIRQTDLKRLIAYSSVSHMGLVLLGVASVGFMNRDFMAVGLTGASMQLFTHGTISALLFLAVGLIYDRAKTRYIPDLGGLSRTVPIISGSLIIAGLASLGLPGMSGFVSEILVFLGSFKAFPLITGLSVFGVVLAAGYILWMFERSLFGPTKQRFSQIRDASLIECIPLVLLVITILGIGIYPAIIVDVFESGIDPITVLITR
ncbi:MAG: oxidoreductase [Dehalococcoidia bacterium]|nr:oxidoreductase [Dehalococcoidia bacterium]